MSAPEGQVPYVYLNSFSNHWEAFANAECSEHYKTVQVTYWQARKEKQRSWEQREWAENI